MVASPHPTGGDDADVADTDITCKDFIRTLAEYLAGELRGEDRNQSELHLAVCPDCVRYLRNYEVTIRMGSDAMKEKAGGESADRKGLPEGLAEVILSARQRSK